MGAQKKRGTKLKRSAKKPVRPRARSRSRAAQRYQAERKQRSRSAVRYQVKVTLEGSEKHPAQFERLLAVIHQKMDRLAGHDPVWPDRPELRPPRRVYHTRCYAVSSRNDGLVLMQQLAGVWIQYDAPGDITLSLLTVKDGGTAPPTEGT